MSERNEIRRGSRTWWRCLRVARLAAILGALILAVLSIAQLGVDSITLETPNWQLWIKLGQGKVSLFFRDETADLDLKWRQGWNAFAVNEPALYFDPKHSHIDFLGIEYVAGSYVRSPYVGRAVRVSYWWFVAFLALLARFCTRKLRRANQMEGTPDDLP